MKRLIITESKPIRRHNLISFEQVEYEMKAMRLILTQRADKDNVYDYSLTLPVYYAIYQIFKFQDKNLEIPRVVMAHIKNVVLSAVEDKSEGKTFRKELSNQIDELLEDPLIYSKICRFMATNNLSELL